MTEHVHVTILVVVNTDRTWSHRDPRGSKEMELSLPQSVAQAMDYNQVVRDIVAQATIDFNAAYQDSLDQSEDTEND